MPNPTLGVMALYLTGSKLEEPAFYRKLSQAGTRLGLDVIVFTPEDVNEDSRTVRAFVWNPSAAKWDRKNVPFPDIIYDRCRFQRTYRFQLLRRFRSQYPDLRYMSRPLVHKWTMHQILSKNRSIRPYLPETEPFLTVKALQRMVERFGLVYVKPIDGTGGRGILRIEKIDSGLYRVQGRNRDRSIIRPFTVSPSRLAARLNGWKPGRSFLLQQGIRITLEDGRVHDYRLLIQKNGSGEWEVTGCAGRIGAARSITSNLHGGGTAATADSLLSRRFGKADRIRSIRDDMDRLAHLVARHVENQFGSMCELALDLAVDEKGRVWLLEINPKPSREVFNRIGEKDTYRKAVIRPLEYAQYMLRRNPT